MLANLILEVSGLAIFVFAATAWLKQMGLEGKQLTVAAFAFGLVFGMAYRYAVQPMVTFADWFWAVAFGLLAGFLATGAYKGAQSIAGTDTAGEAATLKAENKQTEKVVEAIKDEPQGP